MVYPIATIERLHELLTYDPETGLFRWRVSVGQRARPGSLAGTKNRKSYCGIKIDRRIYPAHRIAWAFCFGVWPTGEIDHINGDRNDNRIANLRDVPKAVNVQNQRFASSNNKSRFLGVSKVANHKAWYARIHANGRSIYLGSFNTPEQAHECYLEAKRNLHRGCTL